MCHLESAGRVKLLLNYKFGADRCWMLSSPYLGLQPLHASWFRLDKSAFRREAVEPRKLPKPGGCSSCWRQHQEQRAHSMQLKRKTRLGWSAG